MYSNMKAIFNKKLKFILMIYNGKVFSSSLLISIYVSKFMFPSEIKNKHEARRGRSKTLLRGYYDYMPHCTFW